MAANHVITPEARQDLSEAYAWCEQERSGRGETLLACVDQCIQGVCRSPRAHAPLRSPYRRARVPKFRYVVVYYYDAASNTVFVDVVFHTSRDPQDLLDRLP